MPGQDDRHGTVGALHGHPIGLRGFVGIGGPDDPKIGNRSQGSQVLDRLMGGAILTHADGVVGKHEGHRQLAIAAMRTAGRS